MGFRPLEGQLVRLRALEPVDESVLYRWINDPEVTQWLAARYPFSAEQEREFVAASRPSSSNARFGVETLADGTLIGTCDLTPGDPADRCARLGILLGDKTKWDRGYGTDAMRTLCRFGFEMMNLHRIELDVFAENARAIHVYERLGFQQEGRKRDAMYKFGGFHDLLVMSLLSGELRDADGGRAS